MTPRGGIKMISFSLNHNFIIRICWKKGIRKAFKLNDSEFLAGKNYQAKTLVMST